MALIEQELDEKGILQLTFQRPEKLNALNAELLDELEQHLDEAAQNDAVKALLLTGAGKAFCAGADIQRLQDCDARSGYDFACRGQAIFRRLETLPKISLAAIQGVALGGGCELAMAATFRIASFEARFGQPEIKLGIIPGYGGTQRLARLVGKGRAFDLCLRGRLIDATTALNWGLVNEVVEADKLLSYSKEYLTQLIELPPLASRAIREVIETGLELRLEDGLALEALHFSLLCATKDKEEGVRAFLEKRRAEFQGN